MVDEVSRFAENNKCWTKHKNYLPKSTKELLTRWWECRAQIQSILEPREKAEVQLLLPWSHLLRGNFLGLGVKGWNLLTAKDGVLVKPRSVWSPRRQHTAGRSSDSSPPPYQLGGQGSSSLGSRLLWILRRRRCAAHLHYWETTDQASGGQ